MEFSTPIPLWHQWQTEMVGNAIRGIKELVFDDHLVPFAMNVQEFNTRVGGEQLTEL